VIGVPDSQGGPPGLPAQVIQRTLARRLDQVVIMLETLLDFARPGATERGRRLAGAAVQLAERFDVPSIFIPDLALAARLHEIGTLAEEPIADVSESDGEPWKSIVAAKTALEQVDEFRGAALVIEAIRENWDGSGHPGHLQRGQIPFRSRILRVLIDFYAELDRASRSGHPMSAADAASRMAVHTGTWYDPVVRSQLEASVGGGSDVGEVPARLVLPVSELAAGMVLAEDLCTSSGIKLLSRGSMLTQGNLDIIVRRHQSDPVLNGAWVRRPSEG
jgi:HD domain